MGEACITHPIYLKSSSNAACDISRLLSWCLRVVQRVFQRNVMHVVIEAECQKFGILRPGVQDPSM